MKKCFVVVLLAKLAIPYSGCKSTTDRAQRALYGIPVSKPGIPEPLKMEHLALENRDDYEDARQTFRAGNLKKPEQYAEVRKAFLNWAAKHLDMKLERTGGKAGFELYSKMLSFLFRRDGMKGTHPLVSPEDLSSGEKELLVAASNKILKSFIPRGEVKKVLTAHAVLDYMSDKTGNQRKKFRNVIEWLGKIEEAGDNTPNTPIMEMLDVLEKTAVHFPGPLVLEEMVRLVQKGVAMLAAVPEAEADSAKRDSIKAFQESQAKVREVRRLLFFLAESRVLSGEWAKLSKEMEEWPFPEARDKLLVRLLKRVLSPDAHPADYKALSDYFVDEGPLVAETICRSAAGRFPDAPEPFYCLAKIAEKSEDNLREIANLERAVRRNPEWHEAWDHLARAYLMRIHVLVARQRLSPVRAMLERNVKLHEAAQMHWPTRPLDIGPARSYFAAGRAHTGRGDLDSAMKLYKKALSLEEISEAHGELGEIFYWNGYYVGAEKHFKQAVERAEGEARQVYWLGRVVVKLAHSMRENGRGEEAGQLLMKAMSGLMRLVSVLRDSELRAGILIMQAEILDELGKRDHAVNLLRTAVDLAPDRTGTYADAMNFTVSRGLVNESLDLYSRALVRDEVTEYKKAYATFWILDLGRLCNVEDIRLRPAWDYLKNLKGKEWYHSLARWYRGEIDMETLRKKASNPGELLEADYYMSMRLMRQGREAEGRKIWEKIRQSMIYVYYEFQMVDRYIRDGMQCAQEDF